MPLISDRLEKVLADVCPTEFNENETFFVGNSPEHAPFLRKDDSTVSLFERSEEVNKELSVSAFTMQKHKSSNPATLTKMRRIEDFKDFAYKKSNGSEVSDSSEEELTMFFAKASPGKLSNRDSDTK